MDKRYEPLIIEEKWSELWAKNNLGKNNSTQTFSQVIPPPNGLELFIWGIASSIR